MRSWKVPWNQYNTTDHAHIRKARQLCVTDSFEIFHVSLMVTAQCLSILPMMDCNPLQICEDFFIKTNRN